ncbi:hypothetical protein [Sphingopyxis sp.]|uniref:non-homologous end-joining DNA ligase LigD n=1 Tax=Sphingopyxis sp. TaxID=1908224 RepID=UPI003D80BA14
MTRARSPTSSAPPARHRASAAAAAPSPPARDFECGLAPAVAPNGNDNCSAALPEEQRKGRIFVDYLRNQHGDTAVLPCLAPTRTTAAVASPAGWKAIDTINAAAHFHLADNGTSLKRAGSKARTESGCTNQELGAL